RAERAAHDRGPAGRPRVLLQRDPARPVRASRLHRQLPHRGRRLRRDTRRGDRAGREARCRASPRPPAGERMSGGRPAIALLGSGEFEPWTEEVDRWLLERATGDGSVLVLPTASAPEGDPIFDGWANLGLDHYAQLGIPAQVVPLKTREDADRSSFSKPL